MSQDGALATLIPLVYLIRIITVVTQISHTVEDIYLSYFPFPCPLYEVDNVNVFASYGLLMPPKSTQVIHRVRRT